MSVRIKNCGLKTAEAVHAALETGASYVGFVHCAESPRHVSMSQLANLISAVPTPLKSVLVLVAPDDALLDALMQVTKPDYIQLHHVPSPERVKEIRKRTGHGIISALSLTSSADLALAPSLEEVSDHLLFDAKAPGSGLAFDWSILKNYTPATSKFWFLAGGLTPENVAEAIRATHAPAVDVSSGIESTRGEKSMEKIAAFNAAVLHARA